MKTTAVVVAALGAVALANNGPQPQQAGIAPDCQRYHLVREGDACQALVDTYGQNAFTLADFYKWNPGAGPECKTLWLGYYACIGVPGTPAPNPEGPQPQQAGIVDNCRRYHKVVPNDNCYVVEQQFKISHDQFTKWNPFINPGCTNLWLDYYACTDAY